ncbi:hypothetical protein [Acetivibrio ethanolgignens]|uniref:Type IV pilus assembly protein PilO n=1 Tax=Acetivibrio ethanolgignens TaxID=290052 RepID=A0A0V8QAP1_9FIRM|nr:hypothetical protein [Acetivibrio ethanolgignens]KSV57572.1 hypothetical protein ASU35_15845 [Acetivibrio ethanolgignens]
MRMKITEQEKAMLLLLAALAILALAYFGIFQGTMKKTAALREENGVLKERVDILQEKEARKDEIERDTEEKRSLTQQMIDRIPGAQTTQNGIYLLNELEKAGNFKILSEAFNMNTDFWQNDSFETPLKGYCSQVMISYETTYEDLKKALAFFAEHKDRITVSEITTAYNALTGGLTGAMTLSMYSLEGTERTYSEPLIAYTATGVDNVFRTVE